MKEPLKVWKLNNPLQTVHKGVTVITDPLEQYMTRIKYKQYSAGMAKYKKILILHKNDSVKILLTKESYLISI